MSNQHGHPTPGQLAVEEWLEIRKQAAAHIDPESAQVTWIFGLIVDPYDVYKDIPREARCVGRLYFARAPGSDIWVWFGDLPARVRERLWHKRDTFLTYEAFFGILEKRTEVRRRRRFRL